jgi:sulfite oxidase
MMRLGYKSILLQSARAASKTSSRHLSVTSTLANGGHRDYSQEKSSNHGVVMTLGVMGSAAGLYLYLNKELKAKESSDSLGGGILGTAGTRRMNLPEYRKSEVGLHDSEDKRIWVTFQNGVYDITEFIPMHPGAKNILMAAGGALEPFWSLYAVHQQNSQVYTLLEEYRIGNLHPEDVKENEELNKDSDPYLLEPRRNPGLLVNNAKPFNAETPLSVLAEHFYTPNEWFYVRNHLPTPDVTEDEYELDVTPHHGGKDVVLNLKDLKTKYPKVEVTAAIQCGGNRRAEMNEIKPIKGIMWKGGAIGNAKWSGVRLSDVLKGYNLKGVKHVQFEGYDTGSDGSPYGGKSDTFNCKFNIFLKTYTIF